MIIKLDHKKNSVATVIYSVFQVSYAIEAEILKAVNFPPLKRTITNFLECDTDFFGYMIDDHATAVIEINTNELAVHIQSLVVDPKYFRRGIGCKLVQYVLDKYENRVITVETGLENTPAIKLYESLGFKEIKQWDTDHGVRKVRFEIIQH